MSQSSRPNAELDVLIIGGGFAGASAAVALARAGRSVLVTDKERPRNRFAEHAHAYLTRDGVSPRELHQLAHAEAAGYGTAFVSEEVTGITVAPDGRHVELTLADSRTVTGRRLLLATGLTDVLPDISGVAPRWGRDVIHCPYCHGFEVRGQRLGLIARDTPMTMHHALHLRQWSDRFTLFLNGTPAPSEADLERLAARGIRLVTEPVEMLTIDEDRDALNEVLLVTGDLVPVDALFVMPRFEANAGLLTALGVDVETDVMGSRIVTDPRGATSLPGVWAAGNVTDPFGQLSAAASAGSIAAGAINMDLVEEDTELAVSAWRARGA